MSTFASGLRVEVAERPADLAAHRLAWEDLARNAVEPNVFFEPWLLQPALDAIGAGVDLFFVLVYRDSPRPNQPTQLCGFFPCERTRRAARMVSVVRLWQHPYCFLQTPLVRADAAPETLGAFLDFLYADSRGAAVLELPVVNAEGPFAQALLDAVNERGLLTHVVEAHNRALMTRAVDAEAYLATATSTGNRKELRRQRKRLAEQGKFEARVLSRAEEVGDWIERFLRLEASGWKGTEQTALAIEAGHRAFFTAACRGAFANGQLMMLGLFLDGEALALKCNFTSGAGSFAFKIAFDERFAKFSPGVQLELDNIEAFHARPELRWMDSCAVAGHFMINRLWRERRTVQHLLVSTGRRRGTLLLGLLPFARALKRLFRRRKPQSAAVPPTTPAADTPQPAPAERVSAPPRPDVTEKAHA